MDQEIEPFVVADKILVVINYFLLNGLINQLQAMLCYILKGI